MERKYLLGTFSPIFLTSSFTRQAAAFCWPSFFFHLSQLSSPAIMPRFLPAWLCRLGLLIGSVVWCVNCIHLILAAFSRRLVHWSLAMLWWFNGLWWSVESWIKKLLLNSIQHFKIYVMKPINYSAILNLSRFFPLIFGNALIPDTPPSQCPRQSPTPQCLMRGTI